MFERWVESSYQNAGIPRVYWYGEDAGFNILVMELLNENLEEMYNRKLKREFNMMTILLLSDQMVIQTILQLYKLCRLKSIHDKGIIHRDIKPENFLIQKNTSEINTYSSSALNHSSDKLLSSSKHKPLELLKKYQQTVFLVDYGLSKSYLNSQTGQHLQCTKKQHFVGTAGYSSLNSHRLLEQSRRDDLESLSNIMIYFCKGKLPWQGLHGGKDKMDKYNMITDIKFKTSVDELCEGLPSLEFEQQPDYGYLRRLIKDLIYKESFTQQIAFEWLIPKQERKAISSDKKDTIKSQSIGRNTTRPKTLMFSKFSSQTRKAHSKNQGTIPGEQQQLNNAQNIIQNFRQFNIQKQNQNKQKEQLLQQKQEQQKSEGNQVNIKTVSLKAGITKINNSTEKPDFKNHQTVTISNFNQERPKQHLNTIQEKGSIQKIILKASLINKLAANDKYNDQTESKSSTTPLRRKEQQLQIIGIENSMSSKQIERRISVASDQGPKLKNIFEMRRKTESCVNSDINNLENLEKKYAAHAETILEEEQKTPKYDQTLKKLKGREALNRNNRIKLIGRLNDSEGAVSEINRAKNKLQSQFANFQNVQQKLLDLNPNLKINNNPGQIKSHDVSLRKPKK
ncbi:casein kinase i isoform delta-like protein [Stylonychia lemnae]|uniref:Casein kinase I n=1 Tax=Stylonychia lemnae TaxID=5949 RepID=A0A078B0C6_STYLE|nr:casein kinase i isoform delta-like protein [Stylonychia lemnae]|eukprot:CDW86543.1 casein kinase i isoform delta-like protein [Stylonychia lemnae]